MQNTCENPVCVFAEAGLNFSLNLHIRNILLRPTEDKGDIHTLALVIHMKITGTPKIGR